MSQIDRDALERLGRDAAINVAGAAAFLNVQAEPELDWTGKLIYRFNFVIDRTKVAASFKPGEMRVRLGQEIRDRLLAAGDETYPHLSVISPEEWRAAAVA